MTSDERPPTSAHLGRSFAKSPIGHPAVTFIGIGLSLLVIAAGAILALAVDVHSSNVDIGTIGWIVFSVGVVGLFLSLIFGSAWFRSIYIDRRRDRG